MHWNWTAIVRDTLIVFALTFVGTFVAGLVGPQDPESKLYTLATVNLAFTAMGFAISGVLARFDRFSHLLKVAVALWLVGLVNVLLVGASLGQWALSLVFILVAMGIGGAASYLITPRRTHRYA
jgi:hypothetical protein